MTRTSLVKTAARPSPSALLGTDLLADLTLAEIAMMVTGSARVGGPTIKTERFIITDSPVETRFGRHAKSGLHAAASGGDDQLELV
jgi:hypothetical protein